MKKRRGQWNKQIAFCFGILAMIFATQNDSVYAQNVVEMGAAINENVDNASPAIAVKCGDSEAYVFTDSDTDYIYYYTTQDDSSIQYDISYKETKILSSGSNEVEIGSIYTCEDQQILSDSTLFKYVANPVQNYEYTVIDYNGNEGTVVLSKESLFDETCGFYTGTYTGSLEVYPAAVIDEDGSLVAIVISANDEGDIWAYNLWYDEDVFVGSSASQEQGTDTTTSDSGTTSTTAESGTTTSDTGTNNNDNNDDDDDEIPVWVWGVVACAAAAAIIIIIRMIRNKPNPTPGTPGNGNMNSSGTVLIERDNSVGGNTNNQKTTFIDSYTPGMDFPHETNHVEYTRLVSYYLRGEGGILNGREFPIEGRVTIGRDLNSVVLYPAQDTKISRQHAIVVQREGRLYVKDSSKAGTYLIARGSQKAQKLPPEKYIELHEGDCIYIVSRENGLRVVGR